MWFALAVSAAVLGCDKKAPSGLPPAENWQAPVPSPSQAGGGGPTAAAPASAASDPHAGIPGAPPLSGGAQGAAAGAPPMAGGSGVDVSQLGLPAPDRTRPVDPNKFLEGQIEVGPDHAGKIPSGAAIFVSVRKLDPATGQGAGAPIAVDKLVATGSWPLSFRLTEAQAMIGGTGFSGDVVIGVRFDQDGDALSKQPGDITGTAKASIPAKGLAIQLSTVLP